MVAVMAMVCVRLASLVTRVRLTRMQALTTTTTDVSIAGSPEAEPRHGLRLPQQQAEQRNTQHHHYYSR